MSPHVNKSPDITEAELTMCADTLKQAFRNYSLMLHFLDEDNRPTRIHEYQEAFLRKVGMTGGHVWSADGGVAVSVWTAPDMQDPAAVFGPLAGEFERLAGARAEVMEASEAVMAKSRPQTPCWFLGTVGVHPGHQGTGLARAVIEPGLERAEAEGYPVFLETSDEKNVEIYQRLGFKVTAAYKLPFDGPKTYAMMRGEGG
ncbi:GNAT family N-acetyltransferase [Nocardiopsis kunsanensis]|uniref:N-acetyltransferase domain-containing protein n=1 Tax=Nocardiopsis kunsanensis TaxID=141693 RepID=A0A919CHU2_9ACTN|nr:GNAT family N-acetyltransferase [Nocardiopsis kunsanensis]GHD26430.1 hypothetical protein GCM10007147_24380 [Nocardiopsis kunsanensis]